ncbi:MFS transporter [Rhodospirillaceae bacterium SYSU D60014]|uniref:MFS transporter n=1 Tax=Virgifigura deserti TaxID=2268457 RepID=UPI0013C4F1B3
MRHGAGVSWRAIIAVIACVSVFDVTLGLTYPLLSLILEARGVEAATIGLNAAMTPLGIILSAPIIPEVGRRIGTWRLAALCTVATALLLILFKLFPALSVWFALRFLLGVTINGLFIISEAWINELAAGPTRGRVMGLYTTVLSLGFAVGPFLLPATGIEGWLPFLVGAACAIAALVPLALSRGAIPVPKREAQASLLHFLTRAPTLLAAVAAFGVFDAATLSLLPLYGLRNGLDEATTAYALGVLIAGNVFLQYPLGWLADRLPPRALMAGCAVATVLGSLLLPAVIASPLLLWPLLFLWGGAAFGVYTLALAELGHRFSGALLLAGAAAFSAIWGAGAILGPPLAGLAMEHLGPDGLPVTLGLAYLTLALALAGRWR